MDEQFAQTPAFAQHARTLLDARAAELDELEGFDAVVLGIPYDLGTHPTRIGSRMGPRHIRESTLPERKNLSDASRKTGHGLKVGDVGDLVLRSGYFEEAFPKIEQSVTKIIASGAVPISLGGDGAVTLPQIRSLAQAHDNLVTIHFDAHTDCYPVDEREPFTNATTFTHAATEGLVDASRSFHIGVRGTATLPDAPAFAEGFGYRVISTEDWLADESAGIAELRKVIEDRPVFLSFDMDTFDPAVAPGVCTPEWGGFTAREGIRTIRSLAGFNIVGADITTVSPPHDFQGNTGNLAGRATLEILHLLGERNVRQ